MDTEMPYFLVWSLVYLSPFIFLLLLAVTVIECNNLLYIDNNIIKISLEAQ